MSKPVGYRSPPEQSRWKKGQSGNPTGRIKGQRNLKTDLIAELSEMIQISEGGKAQRITKQRALLKGMTARAIGGDPRAGSALLNLMLRLLGDIPDAPTNVPLAADDQALLDAYVAKNSIPKGGSTP